MWRVWLFLPRGKWPFERCCKNEAWIQSVSWTVSTLSSSGQASCTWHMDCSPCSVFDAPSTSTKWIARAEVIKTCFFRKPALYYICLSFFVHFSLSRSLSLSVFLAWWIRALKVSKKIVERPGCTNTNLGGTDDRRARRFEPARSPLGLQCVSTARDHIFEKVLTDLRHSSLEFWMPSLSIVTL